MSIPSMTETAGMESIEGLKWALVRIVQKGSSARWRMPTAVERMDSGERSGAKLVGDTLYVRPGVPDRLAWSIASELARSTEDAQTLCGEILREWR